jgi:hypothetical protein
MHFCNGNTLIKFPELNFLYKLLSSMSNISNIDIALVQHRVFFYFLYLANLFSNYYRTAILKSLEQLILLGALTDEYKLSNPVGLQMARLPLDPMYSKALIVSSEFKCSEEMLIVVSMLSVESIFFSPREKLEEVFI